MKPLKRVLCLVLCLCMVTSLFTMSTSAADYVNKITVSVYTPAAGFKPQDATTSETASCEVRDTQWSGDFDANGCFISGQTYTITVTLGMKDGVDRYFKQSDKAANYTINGKNAEVVSHSKTKVVLRGNITAAAGLYVSSGHASVAEPVIGAKPADAAITQGQGVKVGKTEWIGELNNGTFQEGVSYTVRCTLVPSMSTSRLKLEEGEKVTINGQVATVISASSTEVVTEFTFAPTTKAVAAVADNGVLREAQFYYNKPLVGDKPSRHIAVAQSDALYITDITWSGDFDENGRFMAKKTYQLEFTVRVRDGVNMTIPDSSNIKVRDYRLNDSLLTVNTGYSSTGKAIRFNTNVYIDLPHDLVDIAELYTLEQADALENTRNVQKYGDLILNNASVEKYIEEYRIDYRQCPIAYVLYLDTPEVMYANRLLVDYTTDNNRYGTPGKALDLLPNITELWLSPEVDVKRWLSEMQEHTPFGYEGLDLGPNCWSNFTVYISSEKYPNGWMDQYVAAYLYPFRIQIYDGDVYTAFEKAGKGEQVGRDWCFKHEYTLTAARPDCVMKYATCQNATWYCYSCEHCGKPELNINHIFKTIHNSDVKGDDVSGRIGHSMTQVIDPKHLIGKNADGDLVYAESCRWCGYNEKQITLMEDLTQAQFKYLYGDGQETLKDYQVVLKESWDKSIQPQILASTAEDLMLGYFVVKAENEITATVRASYSNNVRLAAQEGLVDLALMGNDYNKEMTRLQFCSVAVRLAEKMAGVTITPAPATTFTDCTSEYALKAYAAGITTGQTATTFNPNGTLTRQQMATFIYRALMWVRDNSAIRYTPYESKLAGYTDANLLRSYAKEPMAFMNALGLVNGNTATTLNPNGNCTIQQAITVAYRSLNADKIGWYQAYQWFWDGDLYYLSPESLMDFSQLSFAIGDRVWVTGAQGGYEMWLTVDSPDIDYTNTTMYLNSSDFKPIKELKADDVERYYTYVPQ